jgi:hypothetical protein
MTFVSNPIPVILVDEKGNSQNAGAAFVNAPIAVTLTDKDGNTLSVGAAPAGNGGSGFTAPTSAAASPTPTAANDQPVPAGLNVNTFVQQANGNWYPAAGVDTATLPPTGKPAGTWTWLKRMFFRDTGAQKQTFKNALVSINHQSGVETDPAIQDRALAVHHIMPAGDTATRWGVETIQAQLDINGTPTFNGSPDGEASVLSLQLADYHTGTSGAPNKYGVNCLRAELYREAGAGSWTGSGAAGIRVYVTNLSTVAGNGTALVGIVVQPQELSGAASSIGYVALALKTSTNPWPSFQKGLQIYDQGAGPDDFNIESLSTAVAGGKNKFQGQVMCGRDVRTGTASNTDFAGQLTLANGTASYTFAAAFTSPPIVVLTNTSSLNPLQVTVTKTGFTVTGTGADVVNYIVVGRN